ncbi:hypothetical protein CC1G_02591 [Coprinopsis cinerea okayama7|uniref:Anti-proliferative protein domain-containing protein n=1 Tax=Coprinopsis cinerea (strain Okayama-7 / 130 / ATCC MYA-4618 / FGSC 9003) TaxID=240176 RepID=A8PB94_COPC7|nr:hypothetical protein CC1G_02591 [Coprinopsis cinerea okayama7\|eukprot:XP_001840128.1 hypothetical protein CC1G_02591 [Coprinopsis cinerea okayama7\
MSFSISASISQAINFITGPLALVSNPATVNALQTILRSTLSASALTAPNKRLFLTFTVATPPRPVLAACVALGIQWAEWAEILGNAEFDLIIDARSVVVQYAGAEDKPIVLWTAPQPTFARQSLLSRLSVPQVPISKLSQQSTMTGRPSVQPPRVIIPPSPPRTLAQQLLESDSEEETDELFAMISTSAIISPTPTREKFSFSQPHIRLPYASFSPISSPEPSSPDSSRPSSRSSTFSTFSISDDESLSSATSVSSGCQSERFAPRATASREPRVFVDTTKKNVTKYLYQGGVSNTLGGGVMLGRPSAAPSKPAKAPSPPSVPKYRAPIGGGKKTGANAPSWRRTANPTGARA